MKTRLLFLNQCFDKTRLRNLIAWVLFTKGEKETIEIVEKLKGLGFQFATRAGISLSIDDLKIPSEKVPLVSQAKQQVALVASQYEKGNVTSIEKLQQLVDTWHRTSETLKQTVVSNFQATDKLSPVYMMAFSGARGNISQVRQLAGMRGLMADPQGQIIGFPIRSNFREGLTLTEYMISCYGARKGLVDTALRTADAGYLTRRLVDVSQHMVVKASTCATRRGIVLYELAISGKSALSLRDRLIGRVLAQDVYDTSPSSIPSLGHHFASKVKKSELMNDEERQETVSSPRLRYLPNNTAKVGERNQEISAELASQIAAVQKRVSVRSPLTCSIRHGVCQLCYGWSLSEGRLVNLGEAVGIIAAQSIGEPGTQLTMRTFHTGGVFSGDVMTEIRAPYQGTAHFSNPLQGLLIRTSHGKIAFLTKAPGEVAIQRITNIFGSPFSLCRQSDEQSDEPSEKSEDQDFRQKDKKNILSLNEQGGSISTLEESRGFVGHPFIASNSKRPLSMSLMMRGNLKPEETVFALEASTVVFVRQHEKVIQTQLIAEFSSMGTEINETIEAKRTLFANNAGQISFASLLIGRRIRENRDIVRVSSDLGFVWILSGKQPGPVTLLDLLQKGTHIVNQNTIVAKVPCLDASLFGSKKKVNDATFVFGSNTSFKIMLLGEKAKRASVTGFESLVVAKAVRKHLPSILFSWIRLTSNKSFARNKYHLASSNQYISKRFSEPLSSILPTVWCGNGNDTCQPLLFRPISLDKKAGLHFSSKNGYLGIATSPVREAKPLQRCAPLSTRSQSALCKQPYVSYSPLAVAHSLYSNRAFGKGVTSDNTSVWIFPSQYQTPKNGLTWFDSRYLSQKLNLGGLIWIETEAASLCSTNTVPTASAHISSLFSLCSLQSEKSELMNTSRIIAVNPLAGQPSIYSKLDNSNVDTLHNQQTHLVIHKMSQKERHETSVKTRLNQVRVSPLKRGETECLVTSTNFPNLFAKESRIPSDYFVNNKAQQQTSSRAVLNTSARFAHSRHQYKKRTTAKSWVATFAKSQNFSKQKAFNLQNEYFFREPFINGKADKVTTPQRGVFLFKDVSAQKKMRGFVGHPFIATNSKSPSSTPLMRRGGSTEQIDKQQKSASRWIYCPQQIQKFSTLHESINFYRNRQFDKVTFDSSLVYIKACFNSELLYSVKNNLDCIANKSFLFSERDTAFKQSSQVPLVQTLQREMRHWRPRFLTADFTISTSPFQHLFLTSCQDVRTNRQHESLYLNLLETPGKRENKPLHDSNQATSLSFSEGIEIPYIGNSRFLLHFAGFKDGVSLDAGFTDAAFKNAAPKMKIDGQFGCFRFKGFESHNVGNMRHQFINMRPFAKGKTLGLGFKPQAFINTIDEKGGVVKREGLLFLRKLMQVPQGYALHERTVSFDRWDDARSLAEAKLKGFRWPPYTIASNGKHILQSNMTTIDKKGSNSIDFVESGPQSNPSFNAIEGCLVKISVLPDLNTAYKLSFNTRNCFHLPQLGVLKIRSNMFETSYLQENDKTERYKFLVWKNLMNCKPFLLLRTSSLQVQVVSNTKARFFLPISVKHPLTWHSLVYSLDSLREKQIKSYWHKAENSDSLPVVGQLEGAQNGLQVQKGFLHQLSLRQQITLGSLHLATDNEKSFFDNLKKQASGVSMAAPKPLLAMVKGLHQYIDEQGGQSRAGYRVSENGETPPSSPDSSLNLIFCGNVNQSIAKGQQRRVAWPYSPQATLLTAISKGSSITLPSRTRLTTNYTTQSDSVVAERLRALAKTGFANVLQRQMDPFTLGERNKDREAGAPSWSNPSNLGLQLPKLYTSLFKFVTKLRQTPLITNRKPNHLLLASLLLTTDFCTKIVSNNSYLIRFLGTINLPSASRGSRDSLTPLKRNTDDSIRVESQNLQILITKPYASSIPSLFSLCKQSDEQSDVQSEKSELMKHNKCDRFVSLEERLSPAMGELVSQDLHHDGRDLGMLESSNLHSNTVLLTESDQISMSLSKQRANVSVGQFVTLGEEFVSNYAALASGQIVAIEQNKITLRRTQALLFYAQGVTHVNHGQWVNKNAPILTLTYQKLVTGDIVQGIPKIEQFFEAPATRDGEPLSNSLQSRLRKTYNRLKNSLPHVQAVKHSLEEIQQVLVEGILRVYLSQGVRIADKHLEIVIRQMTSKGQILDVGNTGLFQGEFVNLDRIERINLGTYGQKAEYEPSVLGITQASLGAESFISAASFQETTRVLSRDTIVGKTDFLRGLKERVVLGDVIQAGTGLDDNINYGLLFGVTDT